MVELIVSASVIVIIFSFVLANFRMARSSADLNSSLKSIVNGIETSRSFSLAGRILEDGSFPKGGYGIEFNANPSSYQIFAILEEGQPIYFLPKEYKQFSNIDFFSPFFPSTPEYGFFITAEVEEGICYIGDYFRIIFSSPADIRIEWDKNNYPCQQHDNPKYVAGLFRDRKTRNNAYFYVSLLSGLVFGSLTN